MNRFFDARHELGRTLLLFKQSFIEAGVFSLFINLLMLVPTLYMLQVYDRVLSSRNTTTLYMLTIIMVVMYMLMGAFEWLRTRLLIRIGTKLDVQLSERVFTAAFDRQLLRSGGNPAQALQDLATTRQFIAGTGAIVLFDAPWAPIYLLVISMIHWYLGVFALVAAIILFGLAWLNELMTHKTIIEANKEAQAANMFATNNLRNAEVIEAMGMLPNIRRRWAKGQAKVLGLQVLASDRGGNVSAFTRFFRITFQSLILGFGAWLAITDEITAGGMIGGSILMSRALAPIELLIGAWKQWIVASAAHGRLVELLHKFPAPPPALTLPAPTGSVAVENISVVPPGADKPVLRNLAFRANAGDIIGIIGPSAAGKSTLAKALVGAWPVAAGFVRLDSANIADWDKENLGPYLGYLPQNAELIEGTVAENISRFEEPEGEKVIAAAQMAGVHEMVLRLPLGYNTQVGADGGALSGGQRQRIGLARALYGAPKVVVLDEPDSSLDDIGITALVEALTTLKQNGTTVFFVSHGQRLIAIADKLLALRDGALLAYGPRDQVIDHLKKPQGAVANAGAPQ